MEDRNYNPLIEGYSGISAGIEGYSGKNVSANRTTSQAPQTFPSIQSAVVKTVNSQKISNTNQKTK